MCTYHQKHADSSAHPRAFGGHSSRIRRKRAYDFDLGLYGGADVRPVTGIRDPSYGVDIPLPPAPRLLPSAIQQNPMHQVLPRQGLADAVRIGKPQRADDTEGMYPKTGYARGQKPGLATLPEHPISGPLMPIASNFFPYGPSPLGQL